MSALCKPPSSTTPSAALMSSYSYETLKVETVADFVVNVSLNRPEKRNAMNKIMWQEIGDVFSKLATDEDCRSIVLSGEQKLFTAGRCIEWILCSNLYICAYV